MHNKWTRVAFVWSWIKNPRQRLGGNLSRILCEGFVRWVIRDPAILKRCTANGITRIYQGTDFKIRANSSVARDREIIAYLQKQSDKNYKKSISMRLRE
jgi:hypothetical protein